ncbi:hypothetical protein Plhal304r1_c016g0060061 [Plasmopara halstedii]
MSRRTFLGELLKHVLQMRNFERRTSGSLDACLAFIFCAPLSLKLILTPATLQYCLEAIMLLCTLHYCHLNLWRSS